MRSGDCRSAKHVHTTWTEDATMNEGKQCLRRHELSLKSMSRGGCGKNMLDVRCVLTSYDEYVAMVKTRNECQLSDNMLFVGNLATAVCCAEVLFQPSFLVSLNALPGVLHAERSTKRTTEPDTAQIKARTHETC